MNYFIGDSHVTCMSNENFVPLWPTPHEDPEGIQTIKIGVVTAYNTYNSFFHILEVCDTERIKNLDNLIFCFGEVDCRYYATKTHLEENQNEAFRSLDRAITNYGKFLEIAKTYYYNVYVMTLFPCFLEPDYELVFTTRDITNHYLNHFNTHVTVICKTINIKTIQLWDKVTIDNFYPDRIHLNHTVQPIILSQL